jgi:hypothetical protein
VADFAGGIPGVEVMYEFNDVSSIIEFDSYANGTFSKDFMNQSSAKTIAFDDKFQTTNLS